MKFLLIACVALSAAAFANTTATTKTTSKTLVPTPTVSKEGAEPLSEGTMKMDKEKMPGTTSRDTPAGEISSEIRTKKNTTVTE